MTDDIVTRLRGQACPECGLPSTHNQFDEAADEIERLRKERDRWIQCAEMLVEHEGEEGLDKAMVFYYESQQLSHEAIRND